MCRNLSEEHSGLPLNAPPCLVEQQRKARDSLLRGRDSCQPRARVGSRKLCQVPGSWGTGHTGPYLQQVQRDGHGLQFPQQVHGSLLEGEGRTLVNDFEVSVGKLSSSHTRGLGEHEAVTLWRSTWGQMPREGRHEKGAAVHLTPAQGPPRAVRGKGRSPSPAGAAPAPAGSHIPRPRGSGSLSSVPPAGAKPSGTSAPLTCTPRPLLTPSSRVTSPGRLCQNPVSLLCPAPLPTSASS